jgi:NAD(P) transhydrogenase subunit beta
MGIALVATIASANLDAIAYILVAMAIGALIGARVAVKVEMTRMPELVACLHSFVGLAAVLVGYNSYIKLAYMEGGASHGALLTIELTEIFLGVFIGAVTFTGSVVAFGKLRGFIKSKALTLPGKNWLNLGSLIAFAVLMGLFIAQKGGMIYLRS